LTEINVRICDLMSKYKKPLDREKNKLKL